MLYPQHDGVSQDYPDLPAKVDKLVDFDQCSARAAQNI